MYSLPPSPVVAEAREHGRVRAAQDLAVGPGLPELVHRRLRDGVAALEVEVLQARELHERVEAGARDPLAVGDVERGERRLHRGPQHLRRVVPDAVAAPEDERLERLEGLELAEAAVRDPVAAAHVELPEAREGPEGREALVGDLEAAEEAQGRQGGEGPQGREPLVRDLDAAREVQPRQGREGPQRRHA